MEPVQLPFHINLSAHSYGVTHLDGAFIRLLLGPLRHSCGVRLSSDLSHVELLSDGWECLASSAHRYGIAGVYISALGAIKTDTYRSSVTAEIAAADEVGAALLREELLARFGPPVVTDDGKIPMGLWVGEPMERETIRVDAPELTDIIRNYMPQVANEITELAANGPITDDGCLTVMSSTPGMGKTTVLRALAREWQHTATLEFITQPERIFSSSGNLHTILEERQIEGSTATTRVIVIEDVDSTLLAGGHRESGSLSRLLNLTDGILGCDKQVAIVLTTNAPAISLDPALLRPGRLRSTIAFHPFDSREASRWLGRHVAAGDWSLAELFQARRRGTGPVRATDDHRQRSSTSAVATGTYL